MSKNNPSPTIIAPADAVPPYYWGIDVGGTGIKIGLVDDAGHTVGYTKIPTREAEGAATAAARIGQSCHQIAESTGAIGKIKRAGLGSPGPMNLPEGTLISPPQLPSWWGFNLRDAVAGAVGVDVTFLNDANAAAYGEYWLGSGRGSDSMIMLTLGTGVGGGIIINGMLVNGKNSCGSECGHIIVDPSPTARLCVWGGGRGHLEAYASASAVVLRARERLTAGEESSLENVAAGGDCELTSLKIYHAASQGDALSLSIIDETAHWLGIGVASLVHAIDPGSVVLGGAMNFGGSKDPIGERFLAGVRREFYDRSFEAVHAGTTIKFAGLGGDAGYIGLAGYAKKESQ